MSCVWQHPKSPYWIGQFTDATGRRLNRSTKQTNRRAAEAVAETWEKAAAKARMGELTQAASIKILSGLMETTCGDSLKVEGIGSYLEGWVKSRSAIGRADATGKRYGGVITGFLGTLDPRRRLASIASITAGEIERWRDRELANGKGGTTADYGVKVLKAALNAARRKGLILSNPAEGVEMIGDAAQEREPFTSEEIQALLHYASAEWRGMILFGVWCGLRLKDAADLCWEAVNLKNGTLTLQPDKTTRKDSKPLTVAMHAELIEYLSALPPGVGLAPLFPSLHGRKSGSHGGLSNEFSRMMVSVGVAVRRGKKSKVDADAKNAGRQFKSKGFHSLRHSMITRLADAGVGADVRRAMAGHSSDAVHRKYVHLSIDAQRSAWLGCLKSKLLSHGQRQSH